MFDGKRATIPLMIVFARSNGSDEKDEFNLVRAVWMPLSWRMSIFQWLFVLHSPYQWQIFESPEEGRFASDKQNVRTQKAAVMTFIF